MMKHHRTSAVRTLAGGGAVALLAGAALTLGGPGAAHPHAEGEEKERRHRVVVVEKHGEHAEHRDGAVRTFRMRRGEGGDAEHLEGCGEATEVFNDSSEEGERRSRMIICARGDVTPAARLEMLENARSRLAEDSHLSEEQRARVSAALDREIARLRTAQ